jgi:hypothetical protein
MAQANSVRYRRGKLTACVTGPEVQTNSMRYTKKEP